MSETKHSFNVILSKSQYEKLFELAKTLDSSRGRAIRQAIDAYHCMQVKKIPICANGQMCYVPHMHVQQQPPAFQGSPNPNFPAV